MGRPTAAVLERERQCLELRRAGLTFDAIAEKVGYSNKSAARQAYERALTRTDRQSTDEDKALELDRLDRLQVAVWSKAVRGDLAAVDRVLRISEQRVKLRGLSELDRALTDSLESDIPGATLRALRDRLVSEIQACRNPRDLAPLIKQLTDVLQRLEAVAVPSGGTPLDELARRRRAASAVQA